MVHADTSVSTTVTLVIVSLNSEAGNSNLYNSEAGNSVSYNSMVIVTLQQ